MIKYEGTTRRYNFSREQVNDILKYLQENSFYNEQVCSLETVNELIRNIEIFFGSISEEEFETILERHETEEEARAYFGEYFISKFESLLTKADRDKTVVAIHGTSPSLCPSICENGLMYLQPSLDSTMVLQSMNYGQEDMHYKDYESLLNWGHKNYKGLVLVAIPYECFYKEGLWNHFQDTHGSSYGIPDYKVDPDFILGYVDVTSKELIENPKYSREHNYEGYEYDMEQFKPLDIDNEEFRRRALESKKMLESMEVPTYTEQELVPYINPNDPFMYTEDAANELTGLFNSIMFSDGPMSEEKYKYVLKRLSYDVGVLKLSLPHLKTKEQIEKQKKDYEKKMNEFASNKIESSDSLWDEDFDWDETPEGEMKFY